MRLWQRGYARKCPATGKCVVSVEGSIEEAIKLVKVNIGVDQCTIAFVPCVLANIPAVKKQMNKFAQVTELYEYSNNLYKRNKSYKNCGMAAVVTLSKDGMAK